MRATYQDIKCAKAVPWLCRGDATQKAPSPRRERRRDKQRGPSWGVKNEAIWSVVGLVGCESGGIWMKDYRGQGMMIDDMRRRGRLRRLLLLDLDCGLLCST